MSDDWLDQFRERDALTTPVPDTVRPQTSSDKENYMWEFPSIHQPQQPDNENDMPEFLTEHYLGGRALDGLAHFLDIIPPQGTSTTQILQNSSWTNQQPQPIQTVNQAYARQSQMSAPSQQQQPANWTANLGSARKAIREKAAAGKGKKSRRKRREAAARTTSGGSSSDVSNTSTSASSSSQSSSMDSSGCSSESNRKKRPAEFAREEMNGKKRKVPQPDVTEEDLNDGTEPMVQMTLTAYMKLMSKRVEPKGSKTAGPILPGAFKRLAQKGDMSDVWDACLLCGATEPNRTKMKAHYEAHLPTKNLMAILLGECDKIGQFALGRKSMAPDESQLASFRMSYSLWKQYSNMLGKRKAKA